MTFSIVIPVYNVQPYLRECLDSVLTQTYGDWEAICVDDGSTDGSAAILDEYAKKDGRFRVIHQTNAGVSAARNAALAVASGDWISFLDADDSIVSDYFERFIACRQKCDVNFFSMRIAYQDGLVIDRRMPSLMCADLNDETSDLLGTIVHGGDGRDAFGWTCNKIIRRDLISANNLRFEEEVSYFEDEVFAFDLFQYVKSFQVIPAVLYRYRRLTAGLTTKGMQGGGSILFPVIRQFMIRANTTRLHLLRQHAASRVHSWLRTVLRDSSVSSRELASVFWAVYNGMPTLYSSSSRVRVIMKSVRWLPDWLCKCTVGVLIALYRIVALL